MGQLPRIDEEPASLIETMNRDVVVERTGLSSQPVHGHRRGVLAASKQVDFYQVNFAGQDFLLLLQIQIPAFVARCLVAQAEHLDRRHDPLAAVRQPRADLHKRFAPLIVCQLEHQRSSPRGQRHLGNGG
jgi:hypothetical protein